MVRVQVKFEINYGSCQIVYQRFVFMQNNNIEFCYLNYRVLYPVKARCNPNLKFTSFRSAQTYNIGRMLND